MNAAIARARDRFDDAIREYHEAFRTEYPIGSRVRIVKGNRARIGRVVEVSCHFVRIHFNGEKRVVWKNAQNETIEKD